jgi:hypothetical protein
MQTPKTIIFSGKYLMVTTYDAAIVAANALSDESHVRLSN